jgi:hypothetical protein
MDSSSRNREEPFIAAIRHIFMTTASMTVNRRQLLKLEMIRLGSNLLRKAYWLCMPR